MESNMPLYVLEGSAQVERLGLARIERNPLLNGLVHQAESVRVVTRRQCLES